MTQESKATLIFAGIVILALILWAYFHGQLTAALSSVPPSTVNQNPPVSFSVYGSPTVTGPINFPQAIYNIPDLPPNGVYSPSSCECGCSGGNNEPITYTFPDLTSYYTQIQDANNAALNDTLNAFVGSLPYSEGVFVSNNTPTPFA